MALAPSARRSFVSYVILVAALGVTAGAARYARNQAAQQNELRFKSTAARVSTEIENRLDAYIAMLHGGSGLFAASTRVEFDEFRALCREAGDVATVSRGAGPGFLALRPGQRPRPRRGDDSTARAVIQVLVAGTRRRTARGDFSGARQPAEPPRHGLQHVFRAGAARSHDPGARLRDAGGDWPRYGSCRRTCTSGPSSRVS